MRSIMQYLSGSTYGGVPVQPLVTTLTSEHFDFKSGCLAKLIISSVHAGMADITLFKAAEY